MRQRRPRLRRAVVLVMVVMMMMVPLRATRRDRQRGALRCKLRMHPLPRAPADKINRVIDNLRPKQRIEVLLDRAHASREGDHKRVLDRACDGPRERGERGLLERCRQQEVDDAGCWAVD